MQPNSIQRNHASSERSYFTPKGKVIVQLKPERVQKKLLVEDQYYQIIFSLNPHFSPHGMSKVNPNIQSNGEMSEKHTSWMKTTDKNDTFEPNNGAYQPTTAKCLALSRRFSDIEFLYNQLSRMNPYSLLPFFPEKDALTYIFTKLTLFKDVDYLRYREYAMERFLLKLANRSHRFVQVIEGKGGQDNQIEGKEQFRPLIEFMNEEDFQQAKKIARIQAEKKAASQSGTLGSWLGSIAAPITSLTSIAKGFWGSTVVGGNSTALRGESKLQKSIKQVESSINTLLRYISQAIEIDMRLLAGEVVNGNVSLTKDEIMEVNVLSPSFAPLFRNPERLKVFKERIKRMEQLKPIAEKLSFEVACLLGDQSFAARKIQQISQLGESVEIRNAQQSLRTDMQELQQRTEKEKKAINTQIKRILEEMKRLNREK